MARIEFFSFYGLPILVLGFASMQKLILPSGFCLHPLSQAFRAGKAKDIRLPADAGSVNYCS